MGALLASQSHAAALTPFGFLASVISADQTSSSLREYTIDGSLLQSFGIGYPGPNIGTEYPRSIVVDGSGQVQIYNGTFNGYLTTLVPATGGTSNHQGVGFNTVRRPLSDRGQPRRPNRRRVEHRRPIGDIDRIASMCFTASEAATSRDLRDVKSSTHSSHAGRQRRRIRRPLGTGLLTPLREL